MPQIIEVPGYGQVEFPDGMSDEDIVKAIKANTEPQAASLGTGEGLLRNFAHGASFGWDDELAGKLSELTGGDYQSAKDAYEAERSKYKEENPKSSLAANVGGAVAGGLGLGRIMRAAPGVASVGSLLPKWGQLAAIGGSMGALGGAGDAQEGDRTGGAVKGGIVGAVTGVAVPAAITGAAKGIGALVTPKALTPTVDDLAAASSGAYDAARASNTQYSQTLTQQMAQALRNKLEGQGFRELNQPQTFRALSELEAMGPKGVADLDSVRKVIGNITDHSESASAGIVRRGIDDFMSDPANAVSGNAQHVADLLKFARGNWAAKSKVETLSEALGKADLAAGRAGVGFNNDNAIRQAISSILNSNAKSRGFSDAEIDAMEKIVKGDAGTNLMRFLGRAAPNGPVGTALSAGSGAMLGGPVGAAALPMAGYAFKKGADRATQKSVEGLIADILRGSPVGQVTPPTPAMIDAPKVQMLVEMLRRNAGQVAAPAAVMATQ